MAWVFKASGIFLGHVAHIPRVDLGVCLAPVPGWPPITASAFPQLLVWNHSTVSPVQQYTEHLAAVKAIAWSPHQHGLLASGGGTADRCIRFWNTLTGQPLQCIDTGSQVCNLAWSKHANELVSAHGGHVGVKRVPPEQHQVPATLTPSLYTR